VASDDTAMHLAGKKSILTRVMVCDLAATIYSLMKIRAGIDNTEARVGRILQPFEFGDCSEVPQS
jgi:hypothetical protein